jgi:hypothetical protein
MMMTILSFRPSSPPRDRGGNRYFRSMTVYGCLLSDLATGTTAEIEEERQ